MPPAALRCPFFVAIAAFALIACADEASTSEPTTAVEVSASSVPAPLITPHPLQPTGTAPLSSPPTFAPSTPAPTFAVLDPSRTPRPAPTPRTPEPRAPTPERPPSPVHPPEVRTGLPEVDPVLEALATRDLDAVMAVVELTEVRCGDSEFTWRVQAHCWEADPEARFSGFFWSNFEGAYVDDYDERLALLVENWIGVYAVVEAPALPPGTEPWWSPAGYWVIFVEDSIPRGFEGGFALVRDGRLYGIAGWGEPWFYLEWDGVVLKVILGPPEDAATPTTAPGPVR